MTTQEQRTTQTLVPRRYQIFWNQDGEHISNLAYTEAQIDDINEIVISVVRGLVDEDRFEIRVTDEPYAVTNGRATRQHHTP